jgi:hypothetical protein
MKPIYTLSRQRAEFLNAKAGTIVLLNEYLNQRRGTRYRSWLRHYATSRKVAGSNPDEVDNFNLRNPTSRTMALWATQPLTEMSTRNVPGGKWRWERKAENLTAICEPIL